MILAYIKAFLVIIKAFLYRLFNNRYTVTFNRIDNKWYCDVPGFPIELFEHTWMVAGAARFLDYHSKGKDRVIVEVILTKKPLDSNHLRKISSTLTGGAFYIDNTGVIKNDQIWLCPVTLFLLGGYPEFINILNIKNE